MYCGCTLFWFFGGYFLGEKGAGEESHQSQDLDSSMEILKRP